MTVETFQQTLTIAVYETGDGVYQASDNFSHILGVGGTPYTALESYCTLLSGWCRIQADTYATIADDMAQADTPTKPTQNLDPKPGSVNVAPFGYHELHESVRNVVNTQVNKRH